MRCEPANTIIKKFKGLKPLAKVTNVTAHTVMRWRMPKDKGGTGGVVPHWHVPAILDAAKARGLDISPSDFVPIAASDNTKRACEFDFLEASSIRAFRASVGWSMKDLSDRLGVSFAAVSNWEQGRSTPSLSAVKALRSLAAETAA